MSALSTPGPFHDRRSAAHRAFVQTGAGARAGASVAVVTRIASTVEPRDPAPRLRRLRRRRGSNTSRAIQRIRLGAREPHHAHHVGEPDPTPLRADLGQDGLLGLQWIARRRRVGPKKNRFSLLA